MSNVSPFVSFAPGRVCLFGEHQDYLGLPVIAAAIPLGCRLVVKPQTRRPLDPLHASLEFHVAMSC